MWIQMDTEIFSNPKFLCLKKAIGGMDRAYFLLGSFWSAVMRSRPNGDLSDMDDDDIANMVGYGCSVSHVTALRNCGFIDSGNHVHDWSNYGGKLAKSREQTRVRVERHRHKKQAEKPENGNAECNALHNALRNAPVTRLELELDLDQICSNSKISESKLDPPPPGVPRGGTAKSGGGGGGGEVQPTEHEQHDQAYELVNEYCQIAKGVPYGDRPLRAKDRTLAESWLKTYGFEQSLWMVPKCVELGKSSKAGPVKFFCGLDHYEHEAAGAYEAARRQKAAATAKAREAEEQRRQAETEKALLHYADQHLSSDELDKLENRALKSLQAKYTDPEHRRKTGLPYRLELRKAKLEWAAERMDGVPDKPDQTQQKRLYAL